jgi:hypothetical protein
MALLMIYLKIDASPTSYWFLNVAKGRGKRVENWFRLILSVSGFI